MDRTWCWHCPRIGKVAAATTATALVEKFQVDRIVFTGVAGGLAPEVRVGDLVLATDFIQHDLDASPIVPRYEVPLYGRTRFAADATLNTHLLDAATGAFATLPQWLGAGAVQRHALGQARIHQGLVASGDRFVSVLGESQRLQADAAGARAYRAGCGYGTAAAVWRRCVVTTDQCRSPPSAPSPTGPTPRRTPTSPSSCATWPATTPRRCWRAF